MEFFQCLMKVISFCYQFVLSNYSIYYSDKSGLINFMEFVCSMWNFLTIPREDMGSLAYLIKDPSAVGCISCINLTTDTIFPHF